jgi:hypothetical protein
MKVHTFDDMSTGQVYDLTQVSDDIRMGDILVVPRERVAGFLFAAWPCAVTRDHGHFHQLDPDYPGPLTRPDDEVNYDASKARAIQVARGLGYETL